MLYQLSYIRPLKAVPFVQDYIISKAVGKKSRTFVQAFALVPSPWPRIGATPWERLKISMYLHGRGAAR